MIEEEYFQWPTVDQILMEANFLSHTADVRN